MFIEDKARIEPWIASKIKKLDFSLYVEPFCGSAAVYFQLINENIFEQIRDRGFHPKVVLNKANKNIVELFKTCRDCVSLDQIERSLKFLAKQNNVITADTLDRIAAFKHCYIENNDFEYCIKKWDDPRTLFYIDPPRYSLKDYYVENFSIKDHEKLAELTNSINGQAVIKYYSYSHSHSHKEITKLYPEKNWHYYHKETKKRSELLFIKKMPK